jgi:hypothetical protein
VDYLQLTVEPDEPSRRSFMRPLTLLTEASSPGEVEERRRVFWNIFLMDRFLSVITGWNTSLTAQDVRRRLPCNAKMWIRGERAVTPFFGIMDKSTANIGNLMSYISPRTPPSHDTQRRSPSPSISKPVDTSNVGAQAFLIEATESLSQVTSFFLQQEVNFENKEEVSQWLARFKGLDLRLVQ